jgi:uncharacterized membrane protein YfcA
LLFVYILISFAATLLGSITGLGGGIIIKPALDVVGDLPLKTIGILSAITVFTMSLYSILRFIRMGVRIPQKIVVLVATGSLFGGMIGQRIFESATVNIPMKQVKVIQNSLLAVLLIGVFWYMKYQPLGHRIRRKELVSLITGLVLGMLSSFLGVGGGPFNIVAFLYLFKFDIKIAGISSLVSILFSQSAKLLTITFTGGFQGYDLSALPYMVVAAILGAQLGVMLNKHLSGKGVERLFVGTQWLIFIIAVVNVIFP